MRTKWTAAVILAACVTPAAAQTRTPAPELDELSPLAGTWSCDVTVSENESGPEQKTRATLAIGRDLDDFWYSGRVVREKTADDPRPMTRLFFWSFDQTLKQFVGGWLDSRGSWLTCTSSGWKGDVLTFVGHVATGAARRTARETFTRPTDEGFDHVYELLNVNPNAWVRVAAEHCRKSTTDHP